MEDCGGMGELWHNGFLQPENWRPAGIAPAEQEQR